VRIATAAPRPRAWTASHEPESTVRSFAKSSARSACSPTSSPDTSTARSRHHDDGDQLPRWCQVRCTRSR